MTSAAEHVRVRRPLVSARVADVLAENSLLVAAVSVLAAALLLVAPELLVADSWMTLVAGREIVAHGLPSHEALTVMAAGRRWTDQQWLAQLAFYGLDRLGGLRVVLLVGVLAVAAAFGSAVVFSRLRGASARNTLFAATAAMLVAPWGWQLRAQSLALPLFVWVLGLLCLDPVLRRRRTWLVFPLLVLWANLHGSVILGAAVVSWAGLVSLGALALRRGRSAGGLRTGVLLVAPWVCVLASPYARDLPAYYKLLLVDSPVSKVIQEWQAPKPSGWFLLFFGLALATVLLCVWKRRSLSVFDLGVLALTLGGSLRSTRGITWFALAVAILLPLAMDAALGGDRGLVRRRLGVVLSACFAAIVLAALVGAMSRPASWYVRNWPDDAARAIARATAGSGTKAVWPSDKHSDWILWALPGLRGRVAYDVRFELETDSELQSIVRYKSLEEGWGAPLTGYAVAVVDPSDTPKHRAALRRLGARVIYGDDQVVVLALPKAG